LLRHGAVVLVRDGAACRVQYRPPVGVEVVVTRQDDTTVGVRQALLFAVHVLTASSPFPAPHVSRILLGLGWRSRSLHDRTAFSSTDFQPAYQSKPRWAR